MPVAPPSFSRSGIAVSTASLRRKIAACTGQCSDGGREFDTASKLERLRVTSALGSIVRKALR